MLISFIGILVPIIFIPIGGISFVLAKTILLSVGISLALVLWVIARLQNGSIEIPLTYSIPALLAVLGISFLSALFSGAPMMSLFGEIVQIDTVAMLGSLIVLALLTASIVDNRKKVRLLFTGSAIVFGTLGVFHILRFFFGAESVLSGFFESALSTPLGQWSDIGVVFGLVLLVSTIVLSSLQLKKTYNILLYALFVASLFIVFVVNISVVWVALAVFSFIFLVYLLSVHFVKQETVSTGETRTVGIILASVLIVLSLVSIMSGGRLGENVADIFGVNQVEARPSWNGTLAIAQDTLKETPLFGIGPNRFQNAWLTHKPAGVNQTIFWNTDFGQGVGRIPSSVVTTGILGFIAWLLFLVALLKDGFRALFIGTLDPQGRFFVLLTFLTTIYLWLFAFVYTPGIATYVLTFLSTGVFVGVLVREGVLKTRRVELGTRPSWNFVIVLFSVLLIIGGLLWGYFSSERALAQGLYERTLVIYGVNGDASVAERSISRVLSFYELDRYYRSLAEVRVQRLNVIVSQPDVSDEVRRSEFQETLAAAINAAQRAVSLDNKNYRNYATLGGVYEALVPAQVEGAYASARAAYEEALVHNPTSPALYLTLARLEANNGNREAAREEIANALSLKPNYTEAIFLLSQIEVADGNIQDAIRAVEAATIISPNDPTVYFQLGLLRYNNDEFSNAIGAFENAVRLNSVYSNARYFLGLSYYQVDRISDALKQFERIAELNPGNQEVEFILENLRQGKDPFADAQPPIDDQPESRDELPIDDVDGEVTE